MFPWTKDFNLDIQRNFNAQCWMRIFGLPQEYWRPRTIFSIAGSIGVPICLDDATNKKTFGQFARVLVDIDLKGNLHDQVLVESEGFAFL